MQQYRIHGYTSSTGSFNANDMKWGSSWDIASASLIKGVAMKDARYGIGASTTTTTFTGPPAQIDAQWPSPMAALEHEITALRKESLESEVKAITSPPLSDPVPERGVYPPLNIGTGIGQYHPDPEKRRGQLIRKRQYTVKCMRERGWNEVAAQSKREEFCHWIEECNKEIRADREAAATLKEKQMEGQQVYRDMEKAVPRLEPEPATTEERFGVTVYKVCPFCGTRRNLGAPRLSDGQKRVLQDCNECGWAMSTKVPKPKKDKAKVRRDEVGPFMDGYLDGQRRAAGFVKRKPLKKRVRNFLATVAGGYFIHRQWGEDIPQWIGEGVSFLTGWLS